MLLAVYNGEKYLKQQLDSILAQTVKDIKIVIRDDGSSDGSPSIIDDYCKNYPAIITKLEGTPTGGAKQNFAELLKNCDDDYIMFCDQDDVWHPYKVEHTLDIMQKNEGANNKNTPVLVHTNLAVVDQNLNVISQSFFDYQKLSCVLSLPQLLVQNNVTGCTVMINRALKEKCGIIPDDCIMHDWWLGLVATVFGKVGYTSEPTMYYRQHSNNQVGAKASYGFAFIKRKLLTLDKVRENYNATYRQAEAFLERYKDELSAHDKKIIETYCEIPNMNKCKKIKTVNKYGFKKCTRLRVLGQYILM